MKVCIIEDDKSIINAISVAFEFRWQDVEVASATTGGEGITLVKKESPDVVILDINLPDLSGFEVLKKIREESAVPIIILTVRSDDADVLKGLEAGADDYVTKPFNYMTLLARVRAVLRRTDKTNIKSSQNISIGPRLKVDLVNQKVKIDSRLVKLTPFEYQMLVLLAKNKDKVVSYKKILKEVWGKGPEEDSECIRIYIRRLRKKLQDIPPALILNEHGSGYLLKSK
jgi:DNA-binding response OmpR family regulator